jgi:hypothetical protein
MRAKVMAAAHRQEALARGDADRLAAIAAATTQGDRSRRPMWRRPLTALLAAGLTLGAGVSSVAAAQPGGLLYGVRIWTETLTLPANASARAQAELERLADRLAEAAAATAAGDVHAANAALEAYEAIVNEAGAGASGNAAASATLDDGVRHNIEVLTVLLDRVPEQARDAIEHAIERSDATLDQVRENPAGNPSNGLGPEANPGNPNQPNGDNGAQPNPNKPIDDPNETPKPHKTPKPHPTPKPTPEAERTPRGNPPAVPPGQGNSSN